MLLQAPASGAACLPLPSRSAGARERAFLLGGRGSGDCRRLDAAHSAASAASAGSAAQQTRPIQRIAPAALHRACARGQPLLSHCCYLRRRRAWLAAAQMRPPLQSAARSCCGPGRIAKHRLPTGFSQHGLSGTRCTPQAPFLPFSRLPKHARLSRSTLVFCARPRAGAGVFATSRPVRPPPRTAALPETAR